MHKYQVLSYHGYTDREVIPPEQTVDTYSYCNLCGTLKHDYQPVSPNYPMFAGKGIQGWTSTEPSCLSDKNSHGIIKTTIVPKGWGEERWVWNNEEYCGKVLSIKEGKKCSFHFHVLKDECFLIKSGQIGLYTSFGDDINEADFTMLWPGMSYHVPRGLRHRFYAFWDSEIIEFSTQHFDEDSKRIERGD